MQIVKTIIIAALSARAFVADAVAAGYEVIAIDAFADVDTQTVAKQAILVRQINGNFDTADFLQKLAGIDCANVTNFVYGSGFEGNIELLELVAQRLPVFGNSAHIVAEIKHPINFFNTLDLLNIPYPEVCFSNLEHAQGWLLKQAGGSGGMHIQYASEGVALNEGDYYQRKVLATSVSLLFLAHAQSVQVIGFNRQLIDATEASPYRYAGAISHCPLAEAVKDKLIAYATKLSKHYSLTGLNSLDAMVQMEGVDDNIWVLEINPRLSASFGLYEFEDAYLIDLHIQACSKDLTDCHLKDLPAVAQTSKAHHVFYAPCDVEVNEYSIWPEWVADIPMTNTVIKKGEPVCTALADGISSDDANELVVIRIQYLQSLFTAAINENNRN